MERIPVTSIFNKDSSLIFKAAADTIEDAISDILAKKEYVVLAVPGGRSVPEVFRLLKEKDIPWSKVHIFMVDERLVLIDDKESNYKLAYDTFIKELIKEGRLPEENAHPFMLREDSPDKGIGEYEDELKRYSRAYDIILLSSGEDGHVGAIYPGHHSFDDESEFYIIMHDSPKPPKDRMSMSRKLLLRSKVALVLFIGDAKKEAYKRFLDENIDYKDCPAKLVQKIPDSYALTDIQLIKS